MTNIPDSAVHEPAPPSLQIDFLYSEGCPAHGSALALLGEVVRDLGLEAEVQVFQVETAEEANVLGFLGSPTIRVNGVDIEEGGTLPVALACRAYRQTDGGISALPPRAMIIDAIGRSMNRPS